MAQVFCAALFRRCMRPHCDGTTSGAPPYQRRCQRRGLRAVMVPQVFSCGGHFASMPCRRSLFCPRAWYLVEQPQGLCAHEPPGPCPWLLERAWSTGGNAAGRDQPDCPVPPVRYCPHAWQRFGRARCVGTGGPLSPECLPNLNKNGLFPLFLKGLLLSKLMNLNRPLASPRVGAVQDAPCGLAVKPAAPRSVLF